MKLKDRIGELHQSSGGSQPLAVMAILLAVGAISLLVPILVREILSEGQKRIEYYEAQQRCAETRNRIGRLFRGGAGCAGRAARFSPDWPEGIPQPL